MKRLLSIVLFLAMVITSGSAWAFSKNMYPYEKPEGAQGDALHCIRAEKGIEFVFSDSDNEIATIADIEQYLENARQEYIDSPEKAQEDEEFYGAPALE